MTKQIAVRLPDELVDYLDALVASGARSSRADIVAQALERDRRRAIAERDAEILAARGGYPDLDGLVSFTAIAYESLD